MKRLFLIGFLCLLHFFAGQFSAAAQQRVRAVWVRPFINADAETRGDTAKGRAAILAELERIKRAGLNTVYVEAFWDGYAIYPSRVAPQRPLAIKYGTAAENGKSWDVLQTYLDAGKQLDLKIHAWLHVFHQWSTNLGGLEKSPIFAKHPDWAVLDQNDSPLVKSEAEGANRDIYKVFLSPSNPAVREYLRRVVAELAEKYPQLAGIQWDYIRYPLHTHEQIFDYNPLTLAAFKKETNLDAKKLDAKTTPQEWLVWQNWKTKQVTATVQELAQIIRKRRPSWEISAAVFPDIEQNLRVKMQDWRTWANNGTVDALLPMLYSTDYAKVENWAGGFRRDVSARTKIYPALFIGHFYNANEKKLNQNYLDIEGKFNFDGFGLFAAQSLTDDLIEKLSKK